MEVFKNRNLIFLTTGSFISTIGDYLYNIAIVIMLYNASGSSIVPIAMFWLFRGVFRIPFQFLSGLVVDKYDKKRIAIITNMLSVPFALSFMYLNYENLWIGYLIALVLQVLNDIGSTSEYAILPRIVDENQLVNANTLYSILGKVAMILSPVIASLVVKFSSLNILFIINGLTFLIATIFFSAIDQKNIEENKSKHVGIVQLSKEGFEYLKGKRLVLMIFLVMATFSFVGRFYEVFKVLVSDVNLNLGAEGIVYFSYAWAVSSVISPITISFLKNSKLKTHQLFVICSVFVLIFYMVWSNTSNLVLALLALSLVGIFEFIQGVYVQSLIQTEVDQQYLGRVFSAYKMILTFTAIIAVAITPYINSMLNFGGAFIVISSIGIVLILVLFKRLSNSNDNIISEGCVQNEKYKRKKSQ